MFELLFAQVTAASPLSFLKVLSYITVRAACALLFSFVASVLCGKKLIDGLCSLQAIQPIRESTGDGAISLSDMHHGKKKTPTMGGLLMIGTVLASVLLFADLKTPVLWLAVFSTVGYAAIGFLDDYIKVVKKHHGGLSFWQKIISQVLVGGIFASVLMWVFPHAITYTSNGTEMVGPQFLLLPFLKNAVLPLGVAYILFAILMLTFTSNAVNLTDGLDGLAAGVTISSTVCFALVCYVAGRTDSSVYLIIPHVQGAGELTVLLAALCGSCMGFLWWNSHPAQVFMGDTGSMMLGGLLGGVALLVKQEILLLLVGGVFVAEAMSVILQVSSYKLRKKRIFLMAPLHHHFERAGVPESKITMRFWLVSAVLSLVGIATLKFR